MIRRWISAVVWLFAFVALAVVGLAVFWSRDEAARQAITAEILDLDGFQALVRQEILDGLKSQYQSQHHWGQQTEKREVRLKTRRFEPHLETTTKEVNDGLWQRFVTTLVEPKQNLQTRLEQLRTTPAGAEFTLWLQARVSGQGQFERWRKGIELFDVSTDADMTVQARIECQGGHPPRAGPLGRRRRARSPGDGHQSGVDRPGHEADRQAGT